MPLGIYPIGMKTVLYQDHVRQGAHLVDFHGWEMPLWYKSIIQEHEAVRGASGIFDVSHMGRIVFTGKDAEKFLDYVLTFSVPAVGLYQAKYGFILNENGGVKDDCILYKFPDKYLLVVNASNREKILAHLEAHRGRFEVGIKDVSRALALISLQGPASDKVITRFTDRKAVELKYYRFLQGKFLDFTAIIARTGYTGENGFELFVNSKEAPACWKVLSQISAPCGLGARDSLRLEAGMPLYGNELDEETTPLDTGLDFAVSFDKGDYIGKKTLEAVKKRGAATSLYGLASISNKIPRAGNEVYSADGKVFLGKVTSGTFSPTFKKGIAIALLKKDVSLSDKVLFKQKDGFIDARLVDLPFYSNTRKTPVKREL